ncbi:aldo-keto reductase family 4 member C8 [Orussus abietinus]|uniref:aldo-keto reductase family 4 member C8 n=1 Tax=Orussus abietinus TaxID=222816 RepID=UPI000626DDC3|nr:aldo-keto reductase family 4 member C8 [Orussus abietinus]XP_012270517.1 aldo-keto reductase family 4 member C8 [Orussus abietinus]
MSTANSSVHLTSGYSMPLIGIGTFKIRDRDTIYQVLDESFRVGFRLIDTAEVYGNEAFIGIALRDLLPKYGLTRGDIFITSKLSPSNNGYPKRINQAIQTTLRSLGTSYLDLYLIHWPGAAGIPEGSTQNTEFRKLTWDVLMQLQDRGIIKSIGVSNYTINHLSELMKNPGSVVPAVNQVECHPHYRQQELREFCNKANIHVQAYSSLGTTGGIGLLNDPIVNIIASEIGVTSAQLLLKWALQQGIGVIPKATKKEHIIENIQLDFMISDGHMNILSNLPQEKYTWNPENVF